MTKKMATLFCLMTVYLFSKSCNTTDFTWFGSYGQKTFATTTKTMTWEEAKALADANGGKLAVPNSKEENNYLRDYQYGGAWLGLYDPNKSTNYCLAAPCPADKNRFISLSTALSGSLNFSNWANNEPDNHVLPSDFNGTVSPIGEHWVVMNSDGTWASVGNHTDNNNSYKAKALVEWGELLDCVKANPDPNTTPASGYYCADTGGNYSQCNAVPDYQTPTCTAPAVWNSTTKKCETGGTTTYAATLTSGYTNCQVTFIRDGGCDHPYYVSYGPPNTNGFDSNCKFTTSGLPWGDFTISPGQTYDTGDQCASIYANTSSKTSTYLCALGGTLSGTTCTHSTLVQTEGQCLTNYTLTNGQCVGTKYTCPLGNYACANAADASNTQNTETTPQGANDKKNDGQTTPEGCLGQVYLFNGKDMRCRTKDAFGLAGSCCDKDKVLFGLIQCKPEEKDWAKLTGDGKCHYIGEYCSKKFLGFCQTKKQTYCCFNSKLGRIIQEQGRTQLNIDWGSAESPNCRGFTPDEFQKIDFSKVDFSEFFADVQAKASSIVNSGALQNKVSQTIDAVKIKESGR